MLVQISKRSQRLYKRSEVTGGVITCRGGLGVEESVQRVPRGCDGVEEVLPIISCGSIVIRLKLFNPSLQGCYLSFFKCTHLYVNYCGIYVLFGTYKIYAFYLII